MNIALLHYAAQPVVGGVESVVARHALLMAGAGHSVRVIAGRGAQTDPRIAFVPLPLADSRHPDILALKAGLDAGLMPPGFETTVGALLGDLREALRGVDVLVAHNVCSLNKNLPLTAALKRLADRPDGPRLVLWHHDLAWTTPRYRAELHEGYPWDLLRQDWPGAAQVVVSVSRQEELSGLIGAPPERIRVIPNGVDAGSFLKLEELTRALVRDLGLLAAAPLLLLPVRITRRKNIELAVRCLGVLRETLPDARLVVTGPLGPHNPANVMYFEELKALRAELGMEGAAHFLAELVDGMLPDAVIGDFYRLADALLFPSREEGFGIPVLEAGLAGLPLYCADIPPLRALAGDQAAYFSPDAAPEQVAGLIAATLSANPTYLMKVRVRRTYSWEDIYATHIERLLNKILPSA